MSSAEAGSAYMEQSSVAPPMTTERSGEARLRQEGMIADDRIRVPTLGESVTEATVGRWFKQPGEAFAPTKRWPSLKTTR